MITASIEIFKVYNSLALVSLSFCERQLLHQIYTCILAYAWRYHNMPECAYKILQRFAKIDPALQQVENSKSQNVYTAMNNIYIHIVGTKNP